MFRDPLISCDGKLRLSVSVGSSSHTELTASASYPFGGTPVNKRCRRVDIASTGTRTQGAKRVCVARADLRRVGKAAKALRAARAEFNAAIRAASASGETYRDIAEVAGISHQRVGVIVNEARRDEE